MPDDATRPPLADVDADGDPQLADAVRRIIGLTRTSTVDDAARTDAMHHLASAADILGAEQSTGPYWQTGLSALEQFRLTGDPTEVFPFSPASGLANPIAPRIALSIDEDDTGRGRVTLTEAYNGPPFDTCHGGIIALIYDDLIGMAAMVGAGGGMTARLVINYRKPTPLFRPIDIAAWFESEDGRKFIAKGEMRCDGELLTEAEGLFIRPRGFPPGTATG
jgi:acyl-coenzyme A thioesterase PaaI-like protein